MSTTRKGEAWKKDAIVQLQVLLERYPVIAAAYLTKVRSSQIHELRKRLRDRVAMVVTKNNLLRKSVELSESSHERVGEFVKDLQGSNILLFTDVNPYSLIILLEKSKVRVPAKAGDIATGEIMVPAGNTGLPPGPVISEFGEIKAPRILGKGMREALAIAVEAGFLESGTIEPVLRRAVMNANVLNQKISSATPGNP